jgi:hypothetical protein
MPDVPAEAVHLLSACLPQGNHEVDVFGDANLLHSMEEKGNRGESGLELRWGALSLLKIGDPETSVRRRRSLAAEHKKMIERVSNLSEKRNADGMY